MTVHAPDAVGMREREYRADLPQTNGSNGERWEKAHAMSGMAEPVSRWERSTRYADQPMRLGTRLFGIGGVTAITLLILGTALFTWQTYSAAPPATVTLSVFDVDPPAAPPQLESEIPPGPEQVEKETPLSEPEKPKIEPLEIQLRNDSPIVVSIPMPVPDHGPPVKETTAPEAKLAPPAPQIKTGKPTWEGLVLGALNKEKHYPRISQQQRKQGVPWIRFVMDRQGNVLSSTLERGCGVPALDREAVELPRRAQPLPKPPDDVPGDRIELVVPVEFFIR